MREIILADGDMNPTGDATVNNATVNTNLNYGSQTYLFARHKPNGYGYDSYLQFDVSNLTSPQKVLLRLYGNNPSNNLDVKVGIYPAIDSWDEAQITYANGPKEDGEILESVIVNGTETYYEFDVTEEVLAQISEDDTVSFFIKSMNTNFERAKFNSKESSGNTPQLIALCEENASPSFDFSQLEEPFEESGEMKLSLYPNPTSSDLEMNLHSQKLGNVSIKMFDLTGKIVLERLVNKISEVFTVNVPVNHLSAGVYMIRIQDGANQITDRFLKTQY